MEGSTYLFYAYPGFAYSEEPHMLFGTETFFHLLRPGRYTGYRRVPALEDTELGYILVGRIQHPGQPFLGAATFCLALAYNSLNAPLQHFWTVEEFHSLPKTTQELECESRFQAPTATNDWEIYRAVITEVRSRGTRHIICSVIVWISTTGETASASIRRAEELCRGYEGIRRAWACEAGICG
jgi:hypothetical protein